MEKDRRVKRGWLGLKREKFKGCDWRWRSEIKGWDLGRVVVVVAAAPVVTAERRRREARREAKREVRFEAIEIYLFIVEFLKRRGNWGYRV